ncbi:ABC transporter ATP-binding protein [Bacteroidetes/Chlorobi group bacterium MS-B_bin-24]|jgi:heme exporter protein A|nr:MAG: ABC transporter ATP-binding protein [Bacteroidetes/Chlorobi group bacterium MS-B_bin-24]
MQIVNLSAKELSKSYNGFDFVFSNLTFEIKSGKIFGILGPNGSGKSTLLRILSRLTSPTDGRVICTLDGKEIAAEEQIKIQGFVAPYLTLFEEFKPLEHIEIVFKIRSEKYTKSEVLKLLELFELTKSLHKPIKEYSSGMKQRFKFILALISSPKLLFLDEPFTNLDELGIEKVISIIEQLKQEGKIIVIATNDKREASLCNKTINLKQSAADKPNLDASV